MQRDPAAVGPELTTLLNDVIQYDVRSNNTIRLIPTEGLMSPLQKLMALSVQSERYLHAPPEDHEKAIRYPDIRPLQQIYDRCRDAIGQALDAKHCIPDFLSGMQVMTLSILALTEQGDTVASIDPADGGHELTRRIVHRLGRRSEYLPFDAVQLVVDVAAIPETFTPRLIYIDHSNALYAHDVAALRRHCETSTIVVDISQVLGVIVGGALVNPLGQGADAVVASTHKSLCGPQKALLATNNKSIYVATQTLVGEFISNNHPANVAALAVCLLEAARFGEDYASQLVANARELAGVLARHGWPVYAAPRPVDRLTDTHHLWIDCARRNRAAEPCVELLNDAGIVVNTLFLGRGGPGSDGAKGLRLGTTEVTRLGMGQGEMRTIGGWVADVLDGATSVDYVRAQAAQLRREFQDIRYCVDLEDLSGSVSASVSTLLDRFRPLVMRDPRGLGPPMLARVRTPPGRTEYPSGPERSHAQ